MNGNSERIQIADDLSDEIRFVDGIELALTGLECDDEIGKEGLRRLITVHHERLEQIIARLEPLLGVGQRGPDGGPPGDNVVDIA
jgi:hypothetical protein